MAEKKSNPQKPKQKFSYGAHVKKHAPKHPKAMRILK